jgi:dGTPase
LTSSSLQQKRDKRRHFSGVSNDPRSAGARDRDRILYSEPFRRLIGVTQVVGAHEGTIFHNRLTHSIKVGQIARRLAEKILDESTSNRSTDAIEALGGLDPEVAEAAALAHDIGHPPFGHAGESILDELTRQRGCQEGFEGNAQSFRIITKLAFRKPDPDEPSGLDLCRATLRAALKYPWLRKLNDKSEPIPGDKASNKWGAYGTEQDDLDFALELETAEQSGKSLEACVMDWADDITYAVHDMEDFYRAGIIPLPTLVFNGDERGNFIKRAAERTIFSKDEVTQAFESIRLLLPTTTFVGSATQIGTLAVLRSQLIERMINAFTISEDSNKVVIDSEHQAVAEVLKALTWIYVITSPDLESQRFGYQRIIAEIFEAFCDVDKGKKKKNEDQFLRTPFFDREIFKNCHSARRAADYIASLSEAQAIQLHGRLTGHALGSVRDLIV